MMRYAITADIHGNLVAFKAVLQDIDNKGGVDEIWCLGDIVGYGPEPHACIELLRNYQHLCVAGNHDLAAVGRIDITDFNVNAAEANKWTSHQLKEKDREYLMNLPLTLCEGDFTLAHGSPRQPVWEYLLSIDDAESNFTYFETPFCIVGHSHIPLVFEYSDSRVSILTYSKEATIKLGNNKLIMNPGGIGQPRDHDPRASYAIYDSEAGVVHMHRVEYDIVATQERMRLEGLPEFLINRLEFGR
jgi:diadenosine tetraphosphatase ApaH/serine/threonine PP2A family protein phosphatase